MKIINYCTEWENGKIGKFEVSNLELRWIELTLTEGIYAYRYPLAESYHKAPIVAKGFIVYLLKAIEANPNIKSAKLYDTYYNSRSRQYKEIKESEPDAFCRDLASEFHNKHIEEEQKHAAYSKRLFDYLKEDDYTLIKRYCDSYFAYIKKYGVNTQEVPQCLQTEEAKIIFKKAIEAGFMNEDYRFNGTKYQMAYFVEKAYYKLKLRYKWKYFEELWNIKYLSQTKRETNERFGHVLGQNEIDAIFD
ncbi:MAG TPA: hypothetical protein VKX35_06815 [Fermentimonas sp.]|jgi:hypothetical protein|nr:hypothetical protein [Fermentimonas sp.]